MSSSAAVHSVHVYDDDAALIMRLCGIVSSSLRVGDSVLIVATPEHRTSLVEELKSAGVDVRSHAREGTFTMVDAYEMLLSIMVNGHPDPLRFEDQIGRLLMRIRAISKSPDQRFTVFGEIVNLMWEQGNKQGALELEALWNDALNKNSFHLHCGYQRTGFQGDDEAAVCEVHTHMLQ